MFTPYAFARLSHYSRAQILACGCLLAFLAAALFLATAAHAAPDLPSAGGTLTVNTSLDSTTPDTALTLREALLIARGGTGGDGSSTGLGRALTAGEQTHLSGCTIAAGLITGGCGPGITDSIAFNLVPLSVISLVSSLPPIADSAPTNVNGGGSIPVIDAAAVGAHNGFRISSDDNSVQSIVVKNAPQNDYYVDGNNNQLTSVQAWTAGIDGIELIGDSNVVDAAAVGIGQFSSCQGNSAFGVRIGAGSQFNVVMHSNIGCNTLGGIAISDMNGSGNHTIGPGNLIGSALPSLAAWQNGGFGILVSSNSNTVISNTIGLNDGDGITIYRGFNSVMGNTVISNTRSGLRLYGLAQNNYIGCSVLCFSISGNRFAANLRYGVEVTGTSVAFNLLEGNLVGLSSAGTAKQGNLLGGILLYGAHNNFVGDSGAGANRISGNGAFGLEIAGAANSNTITGNTIGESLLGNSTQGVVILSGSHDNIVGQNGAANSIKYNGLEGVLIAGASTARNTVNSNNIMHNQNTGVTIGSGAHDNMIGSDENSRNGIGGNAADGVRLTGAAFSNTVAYNFIGYTPNGGHGISVQGDAYSNRLGITTCAAWCNYLVSNTQGGIVISGAGSYGNLVYHNLINENAGNGIELNAGAHGNSIGAASNGNLSTDNFQNGMLLAGGAHDNTVSDNIISFSGANGIKLTDANTSGNAILASTVFSNTLDGINERSGATDNRWAQLAMYGNGGLGIDKNAPADLANAPTGPFAVVTSVIQGGGMITVSGTATADTAGTTVGVELYRVASDVSGYGEGRAALGTAFVDGSGHWTIAYPSVNPPVCYTALQTIHVDGNFTDNTSEFGPNTCRTFLPLISR